MAVCDLEAKHEAALLVMQKFDTVVSPRFLHVNFGVGRENAARVLTDLERGGYVATVTEGVYTITEKGEDRLFLRGGSSDGRLLPWIVEQAV